MRERDRERQRERERERERERQIQSDEFWRQRAKVPSGDLNI